MKNKMSKLVFTFSSLDIDFYSLIKEIKNIGELEVHKSDNRVLIIIKYQTNNFRFLNTILKQLKDVEIYFELPRK